MAKMCYTRLYAPDGETVEATASTYDNGKELSAGQWLVRRANSDINEIMNQDDMPQHWQDQIKRWSAWGEKNL